MRGELSGLLGTSDASAHFGASDTRSLGGANDTSALDADNLFSADNDTGSESAGSDVLRFDRRSGGVVTGEGTSAPALTPSGKPVARARSRSRGWVIAGIACATALALAALSALYADDIAARVSAELRPWLVAHGMSQR